MQVQPELIGFQYSRGDGHVHGAVTLGSVVQLGRFLRARRRIQEGPQREKLGAGKTASARFL